MRLAQPFRISSIASSVVVQIFVAFFVIYATTTSGGFDVVDSNTRYRTAASWLSGNGGVLPDTHQAVPGRNGQPYSYYGPFQSALMAPFLAIIMRLAPAKSDQLFKLFFGVIVIPAVSALSLVVLFRALRELRFGERAAFLAVTVIGLATPLWHYGRSGQEENIIGFAFALYLWGMAQISRGRFSGLKLIALASGIIFATRWAYVPALLILLIPLAGSLWHKRADWRRWWPNLAVAAALGSSVVAAVLWYNAHRFGRPFESGYGVYFRIHPDTPFFTFESAPNHSLALLFSPSRGLLWFCPALLLLLGLKSVEKGALANWPWKSVLGACIFTWLFIGSFSIWSGGAGWGPRYLVALLVLLAPAFAAVFASGQRWSVVLAISIVVQLCSTMLPSSSEDFTADLRNAERPGTCTPWVCSCSALCMRGPWAARATANTLSSRPLPTIDLTNSAKPAEGVSMLQTSDFNSVFWWPVRAAYRAHKLTPALAFALCMLVLSLACGALVFFYRRLPKSSALPESASSREAVTALDV